MKSIAVACSMLLAAWTASARQGAASGSLMNPGISVIGDFRGIYADQGRRKIDLGFQEAEFAFLSSIDPYARAEFYIAYGKGADGEYEPEVEEAFISTLSLPWGLRVKAGRYLLPIGRLNGVHPHALPFTDSPAGAVNFLGEEGLKDEGVTMSWLVPNPLEFYQEIELGISAGPAESPLFARSDAARYLLSGHLKNFWETDENTTLEVGVSGAAGPNPESRTSLLAGVDLTLKWKPLRLNRYLSLVWQSELFLSRYGTEAAGDLNSLGLYSFLTWQTGERWFLTGRYDYANPPADPSLALRGYSLTLGFYATEFQKLELGALLSSSNASQSRTTAVLRWVFVIGAHGAHKY